jgi:mRNA-degrading endonuclease RelE of RelBE toxin-antitoxin system
VRYSDQVASALRSLHPNARKEIRSALAELDSGKKCDTKALRPPLQGFFRLWVERYRVIYRRDAESKMLIAEFLDLRASIYDSFPPKSPVE